MPTCETCGNDDAGPMQIVVAGRTHVYDCFECAIQGLAPRCERCGCRIIGHGVETAGKIFCCANCARSAGVVGLRDHEEVLRL